MKNLHRSRAMESRVDLGAGLQILRPRAENPLNLLSAQVGRTLLRCYVFEQEARADLIVAGRRGQIRLPPVAQRVGAAQQLARAGPDPAPLRMDGSPGVHCGVSGSCWCAGCVPPLL